MALKWTHDIVKKQVKNCEIKMKKCIGIKINN